jgi:hypothetical protein
MVQDDILAPYEPFCEEVISMRLKSLLICIVDACLFAGNQAVIAEPPQDRCALPPGLGHEIAKAYPRSKPVSVADLREDARKQYQKDFGARCPGLVKVDFYGDMKPTWALLLIADESTKRKPELVVAHQVGTAWDIRSLDKADGAVAVWREEAGKYEGMYEGKQIRAKNPVILISDYGSFTILYS